MFQKMTALAVCLALFTTSMFAGIDANKAVYRGGSIDIKQNAEAKISFVGDAMTFQHKQTPLSIPYDKIESIEYGQKAGRRIGMAITMTVLFSPLGLLALASKKRNHMVSIVYTNDQGKKEGVVFEFGKDAIRPALTALESKSGKTVEFESEDARKNIGK